MHDVWVYGCRIHGRRAVVPPKNRTPTVVVLGGTALSGRYVLPAAAELAHRFPVWVPDLPGRGRSQAPKRTLTVEDHADYVAAWMRQVGIDQAALVGNSMGCQIAVETAVRQPDLISHLVLQGPTTDASARTVPRQFLRLVVDSTHEPLSLAPVEVVDWFRAGLLHAVDQVRSTLQHHIEDRLPLVACPTLVVRGALDAVVPQRWAREVTNLVPDGQLRQVPGAAHAMVYTNPLELARVTEAFLRRSGVPEDRPTERRS